MMMKKTDLKGRYLKLFGVLIVYALVLNTTKLSAQQVTDSSLKLHYTFQKLSSDSTQVLDESGNGYNATVANGAKFRKMGKYPVLDLGTLNGYLNLGSQVGQLVNTLGDFSISINVFIDATVNLNVNGNFIWSFSNAEDLATYPKGSAFFSAKSTRYAISKTNWVGESGIEYLALKTGSWKNVTYTQRGNIGTIYVDGKVVKTGEINILPKELGATAYNFIGKSPYVGDVYLRKTLVSDFRIYNKALSASDVANLSSPLQGLDSALVYDQLNLAYKTLTLSNINNVTSNIVLPVLSSNATKIEWKSSNEAVISNNGSVTRPALGKDTAVVTLTATLSNGSYSFTKAFTVTVLPLFNDKVSIERDVAQISFNGNLNNLRASLNLPNVGAEGSLISWKSNNTKYLSNDGKLLNFSAKGGGKTKVSLTASFTKGSAKIEKVYDVYVAEDEGFSSYLFVYFTGNDISQESLHFALSNDGFNYRALNGNNPIIDSKLISSTGGIRDPHILRGNDGKTYYMVATDMVSANGWSSNRAMILMKSTNLIDWTSSVVNIQTTYPGYDDLHCVWAPQTIYDKKAGKYMIYWSMRKGGGSDKIYYAYANSTFTALESAPRLLYENPTGAATIDADIIEKDGAFNLFLKTEGGEAGIKKAVSNSLTGVYVLYDKYLDQTDAAVEGAGVFKLINSDLYVLMYDMYTSGTYQFTTSSDLFNFCVHNGTSMNFTPRHGTVMPITFEEAKALSEKWGTASELYIQSSKSERVKKNNVEIDETAKTVFLPVKPGTDLKAFNPELNSIPGATITPKGAQDFTKGAVNYTISLKGVGSKTYAVTAKVYSNPVLDGFYADPEILYSHKTGLYYIYPTSDGFTGWSGTYFKTFSSPDLLNWKDEGIILNLPTDVSWASTNAWAPTIVEKKIGDRYKYFYYFCAAQKIGVAVSDNPTGPFVDSGSPLISALPSGVSGGQQIDPDVFTDPVSGKSFIYWGNGYMACAELNADMISVKNNTTKILTPDNSYREGTEVFYRNGKYYFLWSEDDTRSVNYRVRYATSTSPTGPLTIPANNLVIAKDDSLGIYGTGHNCVIYNSKSDKWYIVYHRFNRPKGITMGDAAGYNREVCIDELTFAEDGSIIQVKPTLGELQ
jgi:uncharacterized membrane protein